MQTVKVRPAISNDIPVLMSLEHGYSTDRVWQMASDKSPDEIRVSFREVRLPRPMRVNYPRDPGDLVEEWTSRTVVMVAELEEALLGYVSLIKGPSTGSAWVTDLVVGRRHRRQGIGNRLLVEACSWSRQRGLSRIYVEMQSKNVPAIRLARKLGFAFAGYSDMYYSNQDIALFFALDLS